MSRRDFARWVRVAAAELNLALNEETVADLVRRDPAFQSADGRFDRAALESVLREAGYTERGYIIARQRDEIREQVTSAMTAATQAPAPLLDILHTWREETRTVSHFTIDPAKVTVGEPDEAKLRETYETNKTRYVVPEFRKVAAIVLTVDGLAKTLDVPDSDIRAAYEQGKALYAVPERRRIAQISFPDRAAAETAAKKIAEGQSFADAAKAAGASETDIDLGTLTKSQVIDPKIAEAAFALGKDQVSAVIEGQFATVLLRVSEIEPGRQKPFEEVRAEIRDRLAADRAGEEIQRLHDLIDDQRAGGKSLADLAGELKVPYLEIPAIDRSGRTPDGKPAIENADAARFGAATFEAQMGVDADAVELGDAGYAWINLLATTPERQKTYDEVVTEVRTLWTEQERRRLVSERADALVARANAGEAMDKLAAEAGGKVENAPAIKRFGAQPGLPEAAVSQAFATPQAKATSAPSGDGASRVVMRIDAVTVPPAPSTDARNQLAAEVNQQVQNDVIAAYVAALQDRYGVQINQPALRQATGADQTQ
jgi:peptidyl-prolyl cis-trans isomerase D